MAVIRRIEAQRSFDIGGIPSTQVDDSVGQGLRAVGGAIQNAGEAMHAMEMRRLQSQMQMEEFATNQEFQRLQDDMSAEFADKQVNIDPSGKGFTESVSGIYNSRAEDFMKNVPEALKPKFSELLATSRNQWVDKAAAAEVDQRNSWYRTGVTERQQILQNQVFDDPAMFDAAKDDAFRTIDASGLPPVEKEALRKKTEEMFSLAVGEREVRDAEANPSSATGAASRLGVPAAGNDAVDVVVSKIIGVESGGKANAKNPNSSGSGLGQFIDSTWLSTVKKYRPDIAQGRSNKEILSLKNDPQLGREMTKRYTQENAAELRKSGMPVNPGTLYLAHFAGIGGAKAVLRSADDASLENVLGPAVIKANGFLSGKSAGWLKDWAAKKMGDAKGVSASTGAAPADPRYANLSLTQRLSIYDNIQAAAKRGESQQGAESRATIDLAVTNAPAAVQATGLYNGRMPTPDDFIKAYGALEGAQRFAAFQSTMDVSRTAFKMQGMSANEIGEVLRDAVPTSSGDDAAMQAERFKVLSGAAERTLKAREADPAAYAAQNFPAVKQAWDAVQSGQGSTQAAIAASFAAQQQLGIRNIQPLSKDVTANAINTYQNQEASEDARIGAVANLLMATNDPAQRRAVFEQLVKAGLPEITEGAVVAMERGDEGAARRLFRAAMIDPSKLPGKAAETNDAINTQIQADLMDEGGIGDIYYGLSNGSVENLERAQRDAKLLTNAVNLRLRNGEALDDAVQGAAKDLYGDVKPVTGDSDVNAQILVPVDEDEDAILEALARAKANVREALQAQMTVGADAPVADGTRSIISTATSNRIEDILSEGYFRNYGDGYAFFDPYTGKVIAGQDGAPLIFRSEDIVTSQEQGQSSGFWGGLRGAWEDLSRPIGELGGAARRPSAPAGLETPPETPADQIQSQRRQLFEDARDSGMIPDAGSVMQGAP